MLAPALALTLALLVTGGAEARAQGPAEDRRAVIAVLPYGTTVEEIATTPGFAPGVVSAGLGPVPVAQTFLDIGQGNRVDEDLYDRPLPRLFVRDGQVPARLWSQVVERADSAPADVVPGLLASTLADAGVSVTAAADSGAALIAVDRAGTVRLVPGRACDAGCGPGLSLVRARASELGELADALAPDDLLIAIAAGARADQKLLPAAIAGEGFDGSMTSASTRTDGIVTSTDIAPTVLERLGVDVPDEMNGSEITASGERDPSAVAELQARVEDRPRRHLVVLLPLLAWLVLAGLAALAWRARGARIALRVVGFSAAWAPSLLLLAAGLGTGELASALLMGVGSVLVATVTALVLPACLGLALACGVTVGTYAIDVVAGSTLTALSVLGPNPGGGVRFFGIGNELEAILTTLALIGTGAALATRPAIDRRRAAAWFAAVAVVAAIAFAPGRFGADVGAAIVLGVGGATAAALCLGLSPRRAAVVAGAAAVLGLAALVVVDLVLGGAHLSRSVLGAGEPGDVADVLERRLRLMVDTFTDPVYPELLVATVLLLAVALLRRDRILAWFGDRWAARNGFLGAIAGILVGTVANDSGSVLLVIGTIYLAICAGFFWATMPRCASPSSRPIPGPIQGA